MENLDKHITQDQIERFIKERETTVWLTMSDETCICYGEHAFNNPTDLPVYHTHKKGGVIVCFNNDISFGIINDDPLIGAKYLNYMKGFFESRGGHVNLFDNDLLYNGRKVLSYSRLPIKNDNRFITTAHISVDMDLDLIKKICTKPMLAKIPGGLTHFGYTKEELLEYTKSFLNTVDPDAEKGNGPIDICVMWVDPSSKRWSKQRDYWKGQEIKRGTQVATNSGAFDNSRYRDWGFFKYWFRGVEQNCPWVNKVFLILEDEDQIPKWLNTDHPKLRIVYHKEFIPNEALPQYNGPAIEMWYWNIPDLSENFIACDDDYYFYNPIPEDLLFENNIPQTSHKTEQTLPNSFVLPQFTWLNMMKNNDLFFQKKTGKLNQYKKSHLPEPRKKSFEARVFKDNYDTFYTSLMYSHFRSNKSYTAWIFVDLAKIWGVSQDKPVFKNSMYFPINTILLKNIIGLNREDLKYDMICFNDTEGQYQPEAQKMILNLFEKHFPNKSSFEL